jgi:hypothetical protein
MTDAELPRPPRRAFRRDRDFTGADDWRPKSRPGLMVRVFRHGRIRLFCLDQARAPVWGIAQRDQTEAERYRSRSSPRPKLLDVDSRDRCG